MQMFTSNLNVPNQMKYIINMKTKTYMLNS